MRWIFISLVVINLAYLGFRFSEPQQVVEDKTITVPVVSGAAPISLLSEVTQKAARQQNKPAAVEELCWAVGPYLIELDAKNMHARMLALDISAYIENKAVVVKKEFWVYLEPLANKKMALRKLKELQRRGVDSFVITEGELANGISLGLFAKKESVDRILTKLAKKKLIPKVKPLERKRNQHWVVAPINKRAVIDEKTRQRLLEGKEKQWKQIRC
jgi:hypothetical protein